jgi:hypothetical protein
LLTAKIVRLYGGTGAGPNVETPHSRARTATRIRTATARADLRKPFDARRDAHIRNAIDSETALGDV